MLRAVLEPAMDCSGLRQKALHYVRTGEAVRNCPVTVSCGDREASGNLPCGSTIHLHTLVPWGSHRAFCQDTDKLPPQPGPGAGVRAPVGLLPTPSARCGPPDPAAPL